MRCLDSWGKYKRWFNLHYLIHRKLMKKSYLQGMQGWRESEGISYQTPILCIKCCFWEGNSKLKKWLSENCYWPNIDKNFQTQNFRAFFGPYTFWTKAFFGKKIFLDLNFFDLISFWTQIFLGTNYFLNTKCFWRNNFLTQYFQTDLLDPKLFAPKNLLNPKTCWNWIFLKPIF